MDPSLRQELIFSAAKVAFCLIEEGKGKSGFLKDLEVSLQYVASLGVDSQINDAIRLHALHLVEFIFSLHSYALASFDKTSNEQKGEHGARGQILEFVKENQMNLLVASYMLERHFLVIYYGEIRISSVVSDCIAVRDTSNKKNQDAGKQKGKFEPAVLLKKASNPRHIESMQSLICLFEHTLTLVLPSLWITSDASKILGIQCLAEETLGFPSRWEWIQAAAHCAQGRHDNAISLAYEHIKKISSTKSDSVQKCLTKLVDFSLRCLGCENPSLDLVGFQN